MIRFIAALCLAASLASPAVAALSQPDKVYQTISPAEMVGLLAELGLTFTVEQTFDDGDTGLAGQVGEQPVRILMSSCKTGGCSVVIIFGLADPAGVTLKFLNDFNAGALVGRVALLSGRSPAEQGDVVVAYDDVLLGVTRAHLATDMALFGSVVERYFKHKREAGQMANIQAPNTSAFAESAGAAKSLIPQLARSPAVDAWVRSAPRLVPQQ